MLVHRLLPTAILSLAFLAIASFPGAGAAATLPGLECRTTNWDSDRDGHAESWQFCATPECGCMCPVVGGVIQATANGQETNRAVWASCQSGYGSSTEPAPDGAATGVRFTPFTSPEIIVFD